MKINVPDMVKNGGISFVGNFLLLNLIHKFSQVNFWVIAVLLIVNVVGAWSLENYQVNKNYKSKQKKLAYLKKYGYYDVLYRISGFVVAVGLGLAFVG